MNLALNPYWQTATAPWRQRKSERSWEGLIAIAVMILLLAGLILLLGEFSRKGALFSGFFLVVLTVECFWLLHLAAAVQFNRPACVRLVPGYLKVQRRAFVSLWLVLSLLQVAAFAGAWALGLTEQPYSGSMWLLVSAGGLWLWVIASRWPIPFSVAAISNPLWLKPLVARVGELNVPWLREATFTDYADVWLLPALAAMAWVMCRAALRSGDAAHRAQASRSAAVMAVLSNKSPGESYRISVRASRMIVWMQTPFHRYAAWLLARPRPGAANALARAELGLGAKTHWVMQVANLGATVTALGLGAYVSGLLWGSAWETLSNPAAILFLGFICWAPLFNWRMALQQTTREQALMLLLPGMPRGVALNRELARRQLIHMFAAWLLMMLAVLCIPWQDTVRPFAWALCVLTLPLLPLVVQDWSRLAPLTFWPVASMVLKGIVWMPGALVAMYYLQVSVLWIALASAVVCMATLVWRWRRLAGFAQAFPVGHRA